MDPSRIREKIGRFRILVIGRANAGKTTILQKVCNTSDNPEIYNIAGEKIDPAVIQASRERGEHDINNQMIFKSNPGFVFHDSRGFEAGGESEFNTVKEFITRRSKEIQIKNQLHVIWYCIPMDEACRSFTAAERKFFSQCDTGIPVIILFTKFDALYDIAYKQLKKSKIPPEDAATRAPKHAEESFANGPQLKFLNDLPPPPKCHVCLPDMNKDGADCRPLIERTAETLDNEVLEQLFVSTQQSNLELCMKYAIERTLRRYTETTTSKDHQEMIAILGGWFPHISDELRDNHCVEIQSRLLSVASGLSPLENIVQLGSAAVIIFEHSFYVFDRRRYLQDKQTCDPSFYVGLEQYIASPHAAAVTEAVSAAVQAYQETVATASRAYEEAVRTAVYPYEGNSPAWMAKLPFKPLKRRAKAAKAAFERSKEEEKESVERSEKNEKESSCYRAKEELIKAVVRITLNHRLPRP